MKLQQLIDLLQHTKTELGPEAEVIFCNDAGRFRRDFNWGEEGEDHGAPFSVTPYKTYMHVDGWKRFCIPIKEIPPHQCTPEDNERYIKSLMTGMDISRESAEKSSKESDRFHAWLVKKFEKRKKKLKEKSHLRYALRSFKEGKEDES